MTAFLKFLQICVFAIFLFQASDKAASSQVSQQNATPNPARAIKVTVCTDHERYSLSDSLRLNALLEKTGASRVYVDRRMFWTGLSSGLKLVITDEKGNFPPAELFSDAMMPPPREGDTSILIPLESGFLYGT